MPSKEQLREALLDQRASQEEAHPDQERWKEQSERLLAWVKANLVPYFEVTNKFVLENKGKVLIITTVADYQQPPAVEVVLEWDVDESETGFSESISILVQTAGGNSEPKIYPGEFVFLGKQGLSNIGQADPPKYPQPYWQTYVSSKTPDWREKVIDVIVNLINEKVEKNMHK